MRNDQEFFLVNEVIVTSLQLNLSAWEVMIPKAGMNRGDELLLLKFFPQIGGTSDLP